MQNKSSEKNTVWMNIINMDFPKLYEVSKIWICPGIIQSSSCYPKYFINESSFDYTVVKC